MPNWKMFREMMVEKFGTMNLLDRKELDGELVSAVEETLPIMVDRQFLRSFKVKSTRHGNSRHICIDLIQNDRPIIVWLVRAATVS